MRTRAAILEQVGRPRPYAQSRPLAIAEVELAPPRRGEALVRITAAGLCHSDLSVINGDRPRPTPMALGHEAAGIVEALGEGVEDLAPGDHVVMVFVPSCGCCGPCAEGRPALCEPAARANGAGEMLAGGRRIMRAGTAIHHHLGVSAFAGHAVVSRRSLVKVPDDLPAVEAALFGCAVLTGVGAVANTARIAPGASVAVIGLGGVGLAALLGAAACGAARIVAVDLEPSKRALALTLGASDAVDGGATDAAAQIRDLTAGGVDYAFEMAGSARALELAWAATRRGGTTVTAGLPNPAQRLALPPVTLVAEERTLKGSYVGSCVPSRDIPRYIALYRQGRLPVDRLLGETLALDDINAAFDRLAEARTLRQVIRF
jgi:alcohol dehydrogenase